MAGRAGRRGRDRVGTVIIRAEPDTILKAGSRDWETEPLEPQHQPLVLVVLDGAELAPPPRRSPPGNRLPGPVGAPRHPGALAPGVS